MKIGIVDCGGANLNSIYYSLSRLGISSVISSSRTELEKTDGLILPGVGSAGVVMRYLNDKKLDNFIFNTNKMTLGICIGMHILFDYSEEDDTQCLGIINGEIKKFISTDLSIPQMGWNYTEGFDDYKHLSNYYYFANSFYSDNTSGAVGYSNYINKFTSVVKQDNYIGCQFHPEKSSLAGEAFLKYFINQI